MEGLGHVVQNKGERRELASLAAVRL